MERGKRTILEMRNVSKTYGGSRALRSASLKIREAEIHSLTGSILAASSMLGLIVSLVPNYSFLGFEACLFTGLVLGLTKVPLILIIVYGISGLLAGLGGAMSAARLFAANGVQLGQSYELDAIAAVILGGTSFVGGSGSIWGTLVGALIIAVLSNGLVLTGVSDIWQYIIKGLVIIGAVTLDRYRLAKTARS
jgi:predicted ABC-type sugar transport system permease subunit